MSEKENKKQPFTVKEQTEAYDPSERYEIIEGVRYDFKPSPTFDHQVLVTKLSHAIDRTCHSTGIIVVAPMDVYLDEDNIVQPDVIFISNDNAHIITRKRVEGAPDLVVEILSPSTGRRDKIRKKALYERFGIKEYWIVDPILLTIDQFVLEQGKLLLQATCDDEDTLTSFDRFPCISVDLKSLFQSIARFREE